MAKLTNQIEVATFCKAHGLPGEVVGRWIWINVSEDEPGIALIEKMKSAGFRWSSRRAQYYHNCGHNKTGRGGPNPRSRYGSYSTDEIAA